jgi:hypothetical protein
MSILLVCGTGPSWILAPWFKTWTHRGICGITSLENFFQKKNNAGFGRQIPKFLCLSIASLEILVSRLSYESRIIYFSKKFYRRFLQIPLSVLRQSHHGRRLLKFMRLKIHQKTCKGVSCGHVPRRLEWEAFQIFPRYRSIL